MSRHEKDSPKGAQENQDRSQDDRTPSSFSQRVSASASGLFQDAVTRPTASTVTTSLASSSAETGKSESSSSSGPSSEAFHSTMRRDAASSSVQNEISRPSASDSFRSQQPYSRDHIPPTQQEVDAFLSNHNDRMGPTMWSSNLATQSGTARMLQQLPRDYSGPNGPYSIPFAEDKEFRGKARAIPPMNEDGAAVVALLSDPTFSLEDLPTNGLPAAQDCPEDLFSLSDVENQALRHFQSMFPEPPSHRVPPEFHPLNLLPNFDSQSTSVMTKVTSNKSVITPGANASWSYDCSSIRNPEIDPWLCVLTNYQDDVWGPVLPLVKEAREEVINAKAEGESTVRDCSAVQRLSMILEHLK